MTTQNNEVDKDKEVEDKETLEENEVKESPTELAARESGWISKEEWVASGKNPDDWRSAKDFVERGELFDEIHKLKDNNKKTSAAFKALVEHHKKVYENAMKDALAKLKAAKKEALENHEIDRVMELDEEIEQVKERKFDMPEVEVDDVPKGPTPTFKAWHKVNKWYELEGDDEASRYADTIGIQFRTKNPNATERELLEHVEARVAKRFPEVFENPASKEKSPVNPKGDGKSKTDTFKLTAEEERACQMFLDQGVFKNKQEYIEEVKKIRGDK